MIQDPGDILGIQKDLPIGTGIAGEASKRGSHTNVWDD